MSGAIFKNTQQRSIGGLPSFLFLSGLTSLMIGLTVAVSLTARDAVKDFVRGGMPDDALIVSPSSLSIGPLALSGSEVPLALKIELESDARIKLVAVEEALTVPSRIFGSFFGHPYGSDVSVIGLEAGTPLAISTHAQSDALWFAPTARGSWTDSIPLPVIVPDMILDAYNGSFAPAHGLPRLSESAFIGRTFSLEAGASSLGLSGSSAAGSFVVQASIAGFTPRRDIVGVIVPIEFVRRVNKTLGGSPARRIIIFATGPSEAETLASDLKHRGFTVSAPLERLKSLGLIDTVIFGAVAVTVLMITTLASASSVFAASAYILERKDEAELCHQLGLARVTIIRRFAIALIIPSVIGSAAGSLIAITAVILGIEKAAFLSHSFGSSSNALLIVAIAAAASFIIPSAGMTLGAFIGGARIIPPWHKRIR